MTIDIPERLVSRLAPVQPYIIEFMEVGLHELNLDDNPLYYELVTFFQTNPTPQQILDLRASEAVEVRISDLLSKNRSSQLTKEEEEELHSYGKLDDFITLVKVRVRA